MIHTIFIVIGASLGYYFSTAVFKGLDRLLNIGSIPAAEYVGAILGGLIFLGVSRLLSDYLILFIAKSEQYLTKFPVADMFFGALGLILGLIIASLLYPPLTAIPLPWVSSILPILASLLLGYLGYRWGYAKRDEIISFFSLNRLKEKNAKKSAPKEVNYKILDTSVIIDGRIADICKTGFLDGVMVIPEFVLEELQHIADSSDVLKRNRGRRGLDVLNRIQKELHMEVMIDERDFDDIHEVDSKLVKLAKLIGGKVVTNDFNLNKVCELQGVPVLNINDLANAVKPVVLPGEELNVQVIKDGKEYGQGVAYLDDGTMIVVEGGRDYIGDHIDVLVTSVLQTSAGRMIFAKPKLLEKAL
jgi:uncharacterized protein YacL